MHMPKKIQVSIEFDITYYSCEEEGMYLEAACGSLETRNTVNWTTFACLNFREFVILGFSRSHELFL